MEWRLGKEILFILHLLVIFSSLLLRDQDSRTDIIDQQSALFFTYDHTPRFLHLIQL